MGWYYTPGVSRDDIIVELTEEQRWDGNVFRTLRKCFHGNTMYALHESGPENSTKKWICVYLLQDFNGSWGYKPMSENMLPYYFDCPLSFLDEADEPSSEFAKRWRQTVRERHTNKSDDTESS